MRRAALVPLLLLAAPAAAQVQPGDRFNVEASSLPRPGATRSAHNPPAVVPLPPDVSLKVPPGYRATLFARGLDHARNLVAAPDGSIILAQSRADRLTLLKDTDGDGIADQVRTFADGFDMPHGLDFHGGALWVGDIQGVWRVSWPDGEARTRMTPPGAMSDPGYHWTRNVAVHPDGDRFYVGIGSQGNIEDEPAPHGTIQEFRLDGSGQRTFASGMRNPVDLTFRPGTTELWSVVNERDGLGDGLVPDYLTQVRDGGFYGWPVSYIGDHPQPGHADPKRAAQAVVPDLLFKAHSAPLGLAFWHGDVFVGLHGSWNAAEPRGYFVARVPLKDGKPVGTYEAFATGFIVEDGERATVWGRPVGVTVGADDALYVADDAGQTVWRITRTD